MAQVLTISGAQIRSDRGLLGISAAQLSAMSDMGWASIQRFEAIDGVPQRRGGTVGRVVNPLEKAGIEFIGDPVDSLGVRLRRDKAKP